MGLTVAMFSKLSLGMKLLAAVALFVGAVISLFLVVILGSILGWIFPHKETRNYW